MTRIAIYAGSFDPITHGHEDLIRRSLEFVDRLVVAVATGSGKQPLFTLDQRVDFIRQAVGDIDGRVEVRQFTGPLAANVVTTPLLEVQLGQLSPGEYRVQVTEQVRDFSRYGHPETAGAARQGLRFQATLQVR